MGRNEKTARLVVQCLDELYRNSQPSITWEEVQEKYSSTDIKFYRKHVINAAEYNRIVDKYKDKLPSGKERELDYTLLNYAPKFKDGTSLEEL